MPANWIDIPQISFNALLLLERVQLSWLPKWGLPETELAIALQANPAVEWYMRSKCPETNGWLDKVMIDDKHPSNPDVIRQAEITVLQSIDDLIVYAVAPDAYDKLAFHGWDSGELLSIADFNGKTVIDIGAGTGRLAFIAARLCRTLFAVEPVDNLRAFIKDKAARLGLSNVYCIDGLIADIPFPDRFADITMCAHVFGDEPAEEYREMMRATKPGGMIILCPGNNDIDNERHQFLIEKGFEWSSFEEPGNGIKRKYWKTM